MQAAEKIETLEDTALLAGRETDSDLLANAGRPFKPETADGREGIGRILACCVAPRLEGAGESRGQCDEDIRDRRDRVSASAARPSDRARRSARADTLTPKPITIASDWAGPTRCPSSSKPDAFAPSSSRSFGHFNASAARRCRSAIPPPRATRARRRSRVAARGPARTDRREAGSHRDCRAAKTIAGHAVPSPRAARSRRSRACPDRPRGHASTASSFVDCVASSERSLYPAVSVSRDKCTSEQGARGSACRGCERCGDQHVEHDECARQSEHELHARRHRIVTRRPHRRNTSP